MADVIIVGVTLMVFDWGWSLVEFVSEIVYREPSGARALKIKSKTFGSVKMASFSDSVMGR